VRRASARRSRPGPSVLTPRPFTCSQVVKTSNSKRSAEALRKKHQHGKPSEDAEAAAPAASAAAAGGAPVGAATGGVGGETGAVGVGIARSIYASSVSEAQPASSSVNGASFSTHSSSGSGGVDAVHQFEMERVAVLEVPVWFEYTGSVHSSPGRSPHRLINVPTKGRQ